MNIDILSVLDIYLDTYLKYNVNKFEKIFGEIGKINSFNNKIEVQRVGNADRIITDLIYYDGRDTTQYLNREEFNSLLNSAPNQSNSVKLKRRVITSDIYYATHSIILDQLVIDKEVKEITNLITKNLPLKIEDFRLLYLSSVGNRIFEDWVYIFVKILENGYVDIGDKSFGSDGTSWIFLNSITGNWSNPIVNPLDELDKAITEIRNATELVRNATTYSPTIIMGANAYYKFKNNPHVRDILQNLRISAYSNEFKFKNFFDTAVISEQIEFNNNKANLIVIKDKITEPFSGALTDMFDPDKMVILLPAVQGNIQMLVGKPDLINVYNQPDIKNSFFKIDMRTPLYSSSSQVEYLISYFVTAFVGFPEMGGWKQIT